MLLLVATMEKSWNQAKETEHAPLAVVYQRADRFDNG